MGIITEILKEIPLSAVLREKIVVLENEMANLKAENLVLKADLQKSQLITKQQTEKIQTLEKLISSPHDNLLQEDPKNILLLLSKQNNEVGLTTEQIAKTLTIKPQVATFHLEELYNKKFISELGGSVNVISDYSSPSTWFLDQEGRRYLIKHKLI